jgi:aldehyde:ferredoxin oxidoreductase
MRTVTMGRTGKILWVDLTRQTFFLEERQEIFWRTTGGGGLLATALLLEKCPPGIDALGAENLLIFASSLVGGQACPGLARFTTAAKSPLTGGIGETRTEGAWGVALKASGADAVVFSGKAARPTSVLIENGSVKFLDARDLWGLPIGPTVDELERGLGAAIQVAAIGPAGEKLVRYASIVTNRSNQASRMGMGAVMGSKLLKAVILNPGQLPTPADSATIKRLSAAFTERLQHNALSQWQVAPPGFSCWLYLHGLDAALCVNNYAKSVFAGIESFKAENFLARAITDVRCPGCPNNCIKAIHPLHADDLDPRSSGIHQEITGAMGPNLGIGDLDAILRFNNICNQVGLDPASLGFTLSFAMELFAKGVLTAADNGGQALRFGDAEGTLAMIGKIVARQCFGDVLAEGSKRAAAKIGPEALPYAMHVKGLEMVPFEPRSQTNLALGYAVAPIGPRYDICEHDWDFDTKVGWDHTLTLSRTIGILERIPMGEISRRKVRNFKALNNLWSGADALDFCIFAIAPTRVLSLSEMAETVAAVTGWDYSAHELMRLGERRNHLMRYYNLREGLTAADDRLPMRFHTECIGAGPRQGDILDRARFQDAIRFYYTMMGWDQDGRPGEAVILDHGLEPWAGKGPAGCMAVP